MIETSVRGEFVGNGCRSIIDKFCERQTCLPMVLPIVAVDVGVLLECVTYLRTESMCL